MKTTIMIIGALIVGFTICHFSSLEYRYRTFKKNVRVGDPVRFYIGEDADSGELMAIEGCIASIRTVNGMVDVYIDDIYPVMGYRYNK